MISLRFGLDGRIGLFGSSSCERQVPFLIVCLPPLVTLRSVIVFLYPQPLGYQRGPDSFVLLPLPAYSIISHYLDYHYHSISCPVLQTIYLQAFSLVVSKRFPLVFQSHLLVPVILDIPS